MTWLKQLIVPNRYDCLYVVMITIFFLGAISAVLAHMEIGATVQVGLAAVAGCLLAIGAVVGLARHSWRRVGIVATICLVSTGGAFLGYVWLENNPAFLNNLVTPETANSNFQNQRRYHVEVDLNLFVEYCVVLSLLPFASWFLFFGLRTWPSKIRKFFVNRLRVSRPRFLIGLAAVLLACGFTNNLLLTSMPSYQENFADLVGAMIGTVFTLIAFMIVIYLPTRFLVGKRPGWLKVPVSIAALSLLAWLLWFVFLRLPRVHAWEVLSVAATFLGSSLYVLSLIAVIDPAKHAAPESESGAPVAPSYLPIEKLPTVWTGLFLLTLVGLIWAPLRYDVASLVKSKDLQTARRDSILRWKSKGQIFRTFEWGQALVCDFDATTDPDVFSGLDGDPCSVFLFNNLAPQVDFSRLEIKESPLSAQFDTSSVTTKQLADFLTQPANFIRFGGCNLIDTGEKIKPEFINQLYFVSLSQNDPHIGKIMAAFESFKNVKSILIQHDVLETDWPQIARASQETSVRIMGELPNDLDPSQMAMVNENVHLSGNLVQYTQATLTPAQKNWLLHSQMVFAMYWDQKTGSPSVFHDLIFAFPKRFQLGFQIPFTQDFDFENPAELNHFVFERDALGNPTGLVLPFGESNLRIETLTQLKVLSFDENWILRRGKNLERQLADISRLTNLEHLAFSSTSSMDQVGFLSRMKSLKFLQIPTIDRSVQSPIKFDSCPSLETITMLGKPDVISVSEFQRLPNLSKLTIVDIYQEIPASKKDAEYLGVPIREQFLKTLVAKLPNVNISIVDDKDFSPTLPGSFQEHLDTKQKELREKLISETAPEQEN